MKKSKFIAFCALFAFVFILGDAGTAKIKNPLEKGKKSLSLLLHLKQMIALR